MAFAWTKWLFMVCVSCNYSLNDYTSDHLLPPSTFLMPRRRKRQRREIFQYNLEDAYVSEDFYEHADTDALRVEDSSTQITDALGRPVLRLVYT